LERPEGADRDIVVNRTVVVRRAAAADIDEAYRWYEAQRIGLGREFLDQIEASLLRIALRPENYPIALRDARRALVQRFPYSVYYRMRGDQVRVVAVIHQNRHPKAWRRRVR
jgi:plasmid stabilization system protein ParE